MTMTRLAILVLTIVALCNCFSNAFVTPSPRVAVSPIQKLSEYPSQQQSYQQTNLKMADDNADGKSSLPFWLDPGTKGGAVFLSIVLFIVPIIGYNFITNVFGADPIEAGKWIGVGFTVISIFVWVGTYIFRVANKDMTYAKQLKDYENAVIAKRLEELDEDEIQALVEDIERDKF